MGLAAAPLEASHQSGGADGAAFEEMSSVLMHREKEFLGFLCQPLEDLEEHIAESCIEALADELRAKVDVSTFFFFFFVCFVGSAWRNSIFFQFGTVD